MTDAMRTFRKYLHTTDQLRREVTPILDPGTDRADDTEVWLMVAGTQSDVLGLLALSDCELAPHLDNAATDAEQHREDVVVDVPQAPHGFELESFLDDLDVHGLPAEAMLVSQNRRLVFGRQFVSGWRLVQFSCTQ